MPNLFTWCQLLSARAQGLRTNEKTAGRWVKGGMAWRESAGLKGGAAAGSRAGAAGHGGKAVAGLQVVVGAGRSHNPAARTFASAAPRRADHGRQQGAHSRQQQAEHGRQQGAHPCTAGTSGAACRGPPHSPGTPACPRTSWRTSRATRCGKERRGGQGSRQRPLSTTTQLQQNTVCQIQPNMGCTRRATCSSQAPNLQLTGTQPTAHRHPTQPTSHVQYMGSSFWPRVRDMLVPAVLKLRTCGGGGGAGSQWRALISSSRAMCRCCERYVPTSLTPGSQVRCCPLRRSRKHSHPTHIQHPVLVVCPEAA